MSDPIEVQTCCPECGADVVIEVNLTSPKDLRLEFWIEARNLGYKYRCSTCDAGIGEPCRNLNRGANGKQYNVWPHKDRFMNRMGRDRLTEGIKEGWINVR